MLLKKGFTPILGSIMLLLSATASATVYNVTASTDSAVSSGGAPGELRYVLNSILNDQAQNMTPTERIIQFDPSVSVVTLQGILPMINLFQGDSTQINVGETPSQSMETAFVPFSLLRVTTSPSKILSS